MTDTEQALGATESASRCDLTDYNGERYFERAATGFVMSARADATVCMLGEHACYEPDRVVVRPHETLPYTWVAEAFKDDTLLARKSADSPREAAALLAKLIR